jgi:hypothetical protein
MRVRSLVLLWVCLLVLPPVARAQDFGVLESAETINRGNFKLKATPMLVFGKNGAENEVGIGLQAGYGFTDRFDAEGGVALFDGVKYFGANAEYWMVRDRRVDVSATAGLHWGRGDAVFDTTGFDLRFHASTHATPRLELYGALDLAFESITEDFIDDSFTTVHLVPGIEYRITDDVDFVAELGLGLNDDSWHYLAGGIAFYLR